ncbi:MAG: helix-turn-helix transcriptional regulator [Chloroflexota bacterium]|nr:helix-turn-helix transcriptional regulator [Chloroflexota bacterium]
MPRRPRRRWMGGRSEPSPRHINRFVRPCLLLLLHYAPSHGYSLIEDLKEFGFERCPVDASMVYRSLRDMEEHGLVVSHWETEGSGPPRRVYRLTDQGDQYLAWWVADLRETKRMLERFLAAYEEQARE